MRVPEDFQSHQRATESRATWHVHHWEFRYLKAGSNVGYRTFPFGTLEQHRSKPCTLLPLGIRIHPSKCRCRTISFGLHPKVVVQRDAR